MSILHELLRWADRNAFENQEADRKRWRNEDVLKSQPGGEGEEKEPVPPPPEAKGHCRVCGLEVRGKTWCPDCLAFTVRPG